MTVVLIGFNGDVKFSNEERGPVLLDNIIPERSLFPAPVKASK
jgi:hypothetical protein